MIKPNYLVIGANGRLGKTFIKILENCDERDNIFNLSSLTAINKNSIPISFFAKNIIRKIFWFSGHANPRSTKELCDQDYNRLKSFLHGNIEHLDQWTEIYFASSGGTVYGNNIINAKENSPLNPSNFYAEMKINSENLLTNVGISAGFKINIFRIANMYGLDTGSNGKGLIEVLIRNAIQKTLFKPFVSIDSKKQYGRFEDYARQLYLHTSLLSNNGNSMNIRNVYSAYEYSIKDAANLIATHFSFKNLMADNFIDKENMPTESVTLSTNYISENTKMNWQSLSQYLNVRYNKS